MRTRKYLRTCCSNTFLVKYQHPQGVVSLQHVPLLFLRFYMFCYFVLLRKRSCDMSLSRVSTWNEIRANQQSKGGGGGQIVWAITLKNSAITFCLILLKKRILTLSDVRCLQVYLLYRGIKFSDLNDNVCFVVNTGLSDSYLQIPSVKKYYLLHGSHLLWVRERFLTFWVNPNLFCPCSLSSCEQH